MMIDSGKQYLMAVVLNPKLGGEVIDEVSACKRVQN